MGSSTSQELETTITNCSNSDGHLLITCDPPPPNWHSSNRLILNKRHPNYIDLRNTIVLNQSYKITYIYAQARSYKSYDYQIENIEPCIVETIPTSIKGFINMDIEDINLKGYKELILNKYICRKGDGFINVSTMRFLTQVDYECNKDCLISYTKFYGSNFYLVTDVLNS
jgi:hypothetical protein